jgi:uncharacterized protein YpuA (DUF1002 family)
MFITDNNDPAFRFEDLARFTFDNCLKYKDPWGYAAQEVYINFTDKIDLKAKRILSTILNKLVYDYKDKNVSNRLKEIEESIWTITKQTDAIKIIDDTIKALETST